MKGMLTMSNKELSRLEVMEKLRNRAMTQSEASRDASLSYATISKLLSVS